jgi:hypothetical protein
VIIQCQAAYSVVEVVLVWKVACLADWERCTDGWISVLNCTTLLVTQILVLFWFSASAADLWATGNHALLFIKRLRKYNEFADCLSVLCSGTGNSKSASETISRGSSSILDEIDDLDSFAPDTPPQKYGLLAAECSSENEPHTDESHMCQ